ncbi:MAG: TetR/AcrR family transcriptional regulator [Clostridia bacterium]|nr:TetR/AcrR family transcriptional regulator [Clostridia bacterium]MBQ8522396.1 TetR/AcrR family transcriptional regulator [Clostridia bacterium]
MNKAESKYYNTALLMNQALIELLNKKEYEFITIKEICAKAGVNRSTFYLHYETKEDLLEECIENTNKHFLTYFDDRNNKFVDKISTCPMEDLILITHDYLSPYLKYIKENKIIHQVAVKHKVIMNSDKKFNLLNKHVFKPIFTRFGIDEKSSKYIIMYYLNGVNAIISEWILNDCKDEIDFIEKIIIDCIRPHNY